MPTTSTRAVLRRPSPAPSRTGGRRVLRLLQRLPVTTVLLAGLLAPVPPAGAADAVVQIRDNVFDPKEVHIDPGDSVTWSYTRGRNTHTVTADDRSFDSGNMRPGATFRQSFPEEGFYPYFCKIHGARGGAGMAGMVVVGNPPPPDGGEGEKPERPKVRVPDDFPTIQDAVDAAAPGSTVVIEPGLYPEEVVVQTSDLVIAGVDRFRTVLHGEDKKSNGILVDKAEDVTIKNLTVRNYTENGIFFNDVTGYTVNHVDAIKGRTYGIYAFNSYDGVIKNSFGYGSGDSAFYVGQCLGCSALLYNIHSEMNYLGYSGTNATGVVITDSTFVRNGAGIVPNTLPTEEYGPNRGTVIVDNIVRNNNYESVPAAGISETVGIPFGTGIWLPGVQNHIVKMNHISNHKRYGVLISQSIAAEAFPINNRVRHNFIKASGVYDLAWDGTGADNCFSRNRFETSGPPEIETLYHCRNRPFAGTTYAPVQADLAASLAAVATREQKEPPDPDRPRCQRGAPGCDR